MLNDFYIIFMQDTWTDGAGRVSVDEQQDCDDFDMARFHGQGVALTFTRKFDTCDDEHDYLIQVSINHRKKCFSTVYVSYIILLVFIRYSQSFFFSSRMVPLTLCGW